MKADKTTAVDGDALGDGSPVRAMNDY